MKKYIGELRKSVQLEKLPVKNQLKHFCYSVTIFHFVGWIYWAIERNPNNIFSMWIWTLIVWLMIITMFEVNQMRAAVAKSCKAEKEGLVPIHITPADYWSVKWLDSLLDIAAGWFGCLFGLLSYWLM